jgi:[citrate (pro-3S)-lyase] ligase
LTGEKANCVLDLRLFAEKIAPKLNISKRFVGTEPTCKTTNQYNEKMKEILPPKGVEVVEIERVRVEGEYVSASTVREYISQKEYSSAKRYLPDKVYEMILTM